ncbi:serine-rich adhesin for platelets [Hetaerina americana]|uniref:serine-rich adhesin for platelets n=1 Tax=Hetaerina americana TaxID=62018 RepID=UPI003A7F3613
MVLPARPSRLIWASGIATAAILLLQVSVAQETHTGFPGVDQPQPSFTECRAHIEAALKKLGQEGDEPTAGSTEATSAEGGGISDEVASGEQITASEEVAMPQDTASAEGTSAESSEGVSLADTESAEQPTPGEGSGESTEAATQPTEPSMESTEPGMESTEADADSTEASKEATEDSSSAEAPASLEEASAEQVAETSAEAIQGDEGSAEVPTSSEDTASGEQGSTEVGSGEEASTEVGGEGAASGEIMGDQAISGEAGDSGEDTSAEGGAASGEAKEADAASGEATTAEEVSAESLEVVGEVVPEASAEASGEEGVESGEVVKEEGATSEEVGSAEGGSSVEEQGSAEVTTSTEEKGSEEETASAEDAVSVEEKGVSAEDEGSSREVEDKMGSAEEATSAQVSAGGEVAGNGEEETSGEAVAASAEGTSGEAVSEEEIVKEEAASAEESAESESTEEPKEEEPRPPEEELSADVFIPTERRNKDHIHQVLKLNEDTARTDLVLSKIQDSTLKDLKRVYDNAIKPLEILYKYRDLSNRHFGDPEIFSKPLILFMGPWSGGKSSIINYLMDIEFTDTALRTGAEPSPAYFNILMWGEQEEILDGTQLAADWTFSGLQKFGQGLLDRLRGLRIPNKLLEKVNIVEIPGILEIRKQVERHFPFNDACQWFIDRADVIFLVYDPAKLDVGPETEAILDQLKGREYQVRMILNKADQVKPEELMRVQGTLIWNISPLMSSSEPPVMYSTSLWSLPYEVGAPTRLLYAQELAFLKDIRTAIDKRVENKIASARRFAVRVRNHAKMVDCYLTTYYNHKSIFGNKKKVSDDIIEHPQNYHIYEGLSTLTNISRYDLPDPEVYRDFFKLNALYDFQLLSSTCTYFKGCPINKLDISIAYDLPELVGKYKRAVDAVLQAKAAKES